KEHSLALNIRQVRLYSTERIRCQVMGLHQVHLLPVERHRGCDQLQVAHLECHNLTTAEPVIEEQTHEERIPPSYESLCWLLFEELRMCLADRGWFCFLLPNTVHLALSVEVASSLVAITFHLGDECIVFS